MTLRTCSSLVLCVVTVGVLAGCGDASMDFHVDGPPRTTWLPAGPVDVFGQLERSATVTLLGVRFEADAAIVTMNGRAAAVADLRAGQVAHVLGTVHRSRLTGIAERVDVVAAIVGPVEHVAPYEGWFVVLGQKVRIDPVATVFAPPLDPTLASDLDVGTWVQVHGWRDADDEILATRLTLDPTAREAQVVGTVSYLDGAFPEFQIGDQPIDYGEADIDVPGGSLDDGMPAVARGVVLDGVLLAREVSAVPWQMVRVFSDPW